MSRAGNNLRRIFADDPEFLERVRGMEAEQLALNETDPSTWAAARKLNEDADHLEQRRASREISDHDYKREYWALLNQAPRAVLAAAAKLNETLAPGSQEEQRPADS